LDEILALALCAMSMSRVTLMSSAALPITANGVRMSCVSVAAAWLRCASVTDMNALIDSTVARLIDRLMTSQSLL
jgi:hypothetical protein